MEDNRLLKYIIFTWLFIMCCMDSFNPSSLQIRLLIWGINGLVFAVWFTRNISQKRGFVPFQEKGIALILYLFLFWACISIFLSNMPIIGIEQMGRLLIALLTTYMFYDFLSRSKENVLFFLRVITFLVLFVCCWAVIESVQKLLLGENLYKNIFTGFGNQNFLGYFLFLFLPLILSYYFIHSPLYGKHRAWRILFFILIGYTFYLCSSRSAWNGLFFALFFLLVKKNKVLGKGLVFVIIIISMCAYLFVNGFYKSAWQKIYSERASWHYYLEAIPENPVWGLGLGIGPQGKKDVHAHSLYLGNATAMGIPSVVLVLAFYIFFLYRSATTEKKINDPHVRAILLGSTATYFGHLVYNLTDVLGILVGFRATSISLFPYILIALPLAIIQNCNQWSMH